MVSNDRARAILGRLRGKFHVGTGAAARITKGVSATSTLHRLRVRVELGRNKS
jgi:hypothetical protein